MGFLANPPKKKGPMVATDVVVSFIYSGSGIACAVLSFVLVVVLIVWFCSCVDAYKLGKSSTEYTDTLWRRTREREDEMSKRKTNYKTWEDNRWKRE